MHADAANKPHASHAFRAMPLEKAPALPEGEMAIPVQIDSHDIVSDPTLSNYETPLMLPHRGRPVAGSNPLLAVSQKDALRLQKKVQAKKTLNGKVAACI